MSKPTKLYSRTSDEFFALCERAKAGEFRVAGIECGIREAAGFHKNGRPKFERKDARSSYTWSVWYPAEAAQAELKVEDDKPW